MPRPSARQEALKLLQGALSKINMAQAMELLDAVMHQIDAEAPPTVDSDSSYITSPTTTPSTEYTHLSHSGDSDPLSPNLLFFQLEEVLTYQNVIHTALNKVQ